MRFVLLHITAYFITSFSFGAINEFSGQMIANGDTTNILLKGKSITTGTFTYGFEYLNENGEEVVVIPNQYDSLVIIVEEYTYNLVSFNPENLPMPFPLYKNERKVFLEKVLEGYYSIYYIDLNIDPTAFNNLNTGQNQFKDDGSMNPNYKNSYQGMSSMFLFNCESDENYKKGVLRNIKFYDNKAVKECPQAMKIAKERKMFIAGVNSSNYSKIAEYYHELYGAVNEFCSK